MPGTKPTLETKKDLYTYMKGLEIDKTEILLWIISVAFFFSFSVKVTFVTY